MCKLGSIWPQKSDLLSGVQQANQWYTQERHWLFISELLKPGHLVILQKSNTTTIKTFYYLLFIFLQTEDLVFISYKLQSSLINQYSLANGSLASHAN